jgi:uncharacterized protein YebE (UPF0316 family)
MFCSSLPPVDCSMAHVLFTLFVMFAYSGIQNILCCIIVLFVFDYPNVASFYILSIRVPLTIMHLRHVFICISLFKIIIILVFLCILQNISRNNNVDTTFTKCIACICWNLQFLNNVIINKTKVSLPQAYVTFW